MNNTAQQSERLTRADFRVAIAFHKPVLIRYAGGDGQDFTLRIIEPHEMRETKDGNTIIVAMCRLKGERRHFRLDRVERYEPLKAGFKLELPAKVENPEEITDWWTFRSDTNVELFQLELNTDHLDDPYPTLFDTAKARSAKVRAVVKAEGGVSIRRLRRKDVLALR